MIFARRNVNRYKRMYNKKQAVELLKRDKRTKKVGDKIRKLTVYTNPIVPKCTDVKNIFIYPIGRFKIEIKETVKYLSTLIERVNGPFNPEYTDGSGFTHFHIRPSWSNRGICWGSADEEVENIQYNKDWFWLVKRCLDLLEDGNPENGHENSFYYSMIGLQIKTAREDKNKEALFRLRKILRRYDVYKRIRTDYYEELREWALL